MMLDQLVDRLHPHLQAAVDGHTHGVDGTLTALMKRLDGPPDKALETTAVRVLAANVVVIRRVHALVEPTLELYSTL